MVLAGGGRAAGVDSRRRGGGSARRAGGRCRSAGARRCPWPSGRGAVRRRHRALDSPGGGAAADGSWVVGDSWRPAPSPGRCRAAGARSTLGGPSRAGRLVVPDPAHDLGGARLSGARRVVVRAGRRAGDPARQRRGLRRQGGQPAPRDGPPAGRRARRPVRVLPRREDVARLGPKRPPLAAGVRSDGTACPGRADPASPRPSALAPGVVVEEVDVNGRPPSAALRAAGWPRRRSLLRLGRPLRRGRRPERCVARPGRRRGVRVLPLRQPLDAVVLRSTASGRPTWRSVGPQRGPRRGRRWHGARPHDSLLRHPPRRRPPAG